MSIQKETYAPPLIRPSGTFSRTGRRLSRLRASALKIGWVATREGASYRIAPGSAGGTEDSGKWARRRPPQRGAFGGGAKNTWTNVLGLWRPPARPLKLWRTGSPGRAGGNSGRRAFAPRRCPP